MKKILKNFNFNSKQCLLLVFLVHSNYSICKNENFKNVEILKKDVNDTLASKLFDDKLFKFISYTPTDIHTLKQSYWIRFDYAKKDTQKAYYLNFPFMLFQKVDLYYHINDSLKHFTNGISLPFKERNFHTPNVYLELPNTSKPTVCLLHLQSFYDYFFFMREVDSVEVLKMEVNHASIEYFFVGLTILTLLFSIIFYIYLKDRLYLYYALFSFMLLISRLTFSGFIYNYITYIIDIDNLKTILNLYGISYGCINIALILYFYEYFKFYQRSRKYSNLIYSILTLRIIFLIIHLATSDALILKIVDNHLVDLAIQFLLLFIAFRTPRQFLKPSLIAIVSLLILILGNLLFVLPDWGLINLEVDSYYLFLNLEAIEVVVFAIGIAYRSNFLKLERNVAVDKMIENLKESEQLKDNINKELEIKVAERTQQINEMNLLLKTHNIELKSEVMLANEARVFQKNMSFEDFKKIFPDEIACYEYLAKLKWKPKSIIKCSKCEYEGYTKLPNLSIRCGKCSNIESPTNGTLFHRLKFSIQKAFYITYLSSMDTKETNNISEIAKIIDLRPATAWTFKQKVLALMEDNKSKKKHKDGWTHLIEYSINK